MCIRSTEDPKSQSEKTLVINRSHYELTPKKVIESFTSRKKQLFCV